MWRRWFRFRLGTLLVLIGLFGVALAYGKRAQHLRHLATVYASQAQDCADSGWAAVRFGGRANNESRRFAAQQGSLYAYYRERAEECRFAAWRPWVILKDATPPAEVPENYVP